MPPVEIAGCPVSLVCDPPAPRVKLTARRGPEPGVAYLDIEVASDTPVRPGRIELSWEFPLVNAHHCLTTARVAEPSGFGRARVNSSATTQAPVWNLHDLAGTNRLTFALAEAIEASELGGWVVEETACAHCCVRLFCAPVAPLTHYRTCVRVDTRPRPWSETLAAVSEWWAAMPEYAPAPVPEAARLPTTSRRAGRPSIARNWRTTATRRPAC